MMNDGDKLRYPIGRFLRELVERLNDAQLDIPYRPCGWTIRQVVHHVPESHMNAYIRTKLAVTEDSPTIKTYEEARWAELPDVKLAPVAMSLDLLTAVHRRWVVFLRALPESEFQKTFRHPESGPVTVDEAIAMYAWHGRHHVAHVRQALAGRGDGLKAPPRH
jgi:DinB superfamily